MSTENICECTRCSSALSPAGYLIALLEFVEEYFGEDYNSLFNSRMCRPELISSELSCELVERPVTQIEIANKVLINYIHNKVGYNENKKSLEVYNFLKNSWNPPPYYYEGTRFKEYITVLGTSLAEIHSIFVNPEGETDFDNPYIARHLAEKIGLSYPELNRMITELDRNNTATVLGIKKEELDKALELIGNWSAWESLGNPSGVEFTSDQITISHNNNRIDLFARGNDNKFWYKWFDFEGYNWSDWESLETPSNVEFTSDLFEASWHKNRIYVFGWGNDRKLWYKWFDFDTRNWSGWESLAKPQDLELISKITVVSSDNSGINIFLEDPLSPRIKNIWYKRFDGRNWSEWETLGKPSGVDFNSNPAAVSLNNDRIEVFVRGNDDKLWHKWFNGHWSDWESLGKPSGVDFNSNPAAVSLNNDRIEVFVRGNDNKLWHKSFNGHWSYWESLGKPSGVDFNSNPIAVSSNNIIYIFSRGDDHKLWYKMYDNHWTGWKSLNHPSNSDPTISWIKGRIGVFVHGNDQNFMYRLFEENNDEKAELLSNLLAINKDDFCKLLKLLYINVDDPNDILDISTFDKLRRVTALSRALGITIEDIVNILTIFNPEYLNIEVIKRTNDIISLCNDLGLSGTELSNFLIDPSESENQIKQLIDLLGFSTQNALDETLGMPNPTCDSVSRFFKVTPDEVKKIRENCNDLNYPDLKKLYRISRFAERFGIKLNVLLDLFNSLDPIINDINSLNNITKIWNLIKRIQSSGISIEEFVMLRRSLTDEELAEHLGISVNELRYGVQILQKKENLAELLGISINELDILFELNIKDDSDDELDEVSKIKNLDHLKLLHQPTRFAKVLGINLEELKLILASIVINTDDDPNEISNEQVLYAKDMVSLIHLVGLDIPKISRVIRVLDDEELRIALGFDYKFLFSWSEFSEDDKEKLKRYLNEECNIDWINDADFVKTDLTLSISKEEKKLIITLEAEKAILKFSEDKTYDLKVKTEDGKTNIYSNELMDLIEFKDDETILGSLSEKLGIASDDIKNLITVLDIAQISNVSGIKKIYRFVILAQQLGLSIEELEALLNKLNLSLTDINNYLRVCALAITPDNIKDLLSASDLNDFKDIESYRQVYWLYRINSLSNSLGLNINEFSKLNKWEDEIGESEVEYLDSILKSQYHETQLENEKKKPDERIRQKTREALLRYAIVEIPRNSQFNLPKTIESLSARLLIDLNYSPCNMITEIQQAIESVQTFVIRARAGQENILSIDDETAQKMESEWRWMRRYVLWEASQKVFIYPENYVMPQLRDNKTPFFNELDEELSQGEVTQALAEKAITSYIDKLQLISALRVSGTVFDSDTSMLYIFARSQINATDTYYRTLKYERIWSPWVKLDMEIKSDKVHPVIAYGRVYIFWIESEGDDESKNYKHKLFYCYEFEKEKWSKPQSIEISRPLSTVKNIGINAWQEDDGINVVVGNLNFAEKGLYYKYYEAPEGTDIDKLPDFDKIIPKRVGTIHNFNISVKDREDNFAIQFDGFISIEQDGEYTFCTKSDDGSQLFIGESLVVDNDGFHEAIKIKESYPVILKKGRYPIRVTYFNREGSNSLEVGYKINETSKTSEAFSLYRTEAFKLTCNGIFSMLDISLKEDKFIRPNFINNVYSGENSVYLRRIGTNGNVEIGYNIFSEGERWNCKAAYDNNKVTMLFVNGTELQFALFDFGLYDFRLNDFSYEPELGSTTVSGSERVSKRLRVSKWLIHLNVSFRNQDSISIDETFRIDDAIVINDKTYFFCSDYNQSIMIVANVNVDASGVHQADFSNCRINYGRQCDLANELFQKHIDAMHAPNFQNIFEFSGPNKIYNWELFFHIPHFIANGLNQNMKFEAARDWYHYIFNPYSVNSDSSDSAAEWHFKPFKDNIFEKLQDYLTDPEEVAVWVEDPYNPHALARIRPGTYQKAIILEYVDNLLDWADQEFTRDTRESLNRALGFYEVSRKLLKLEEIEHERPCGLLIKDLKLVIRQAVPWIRVEELLEKLELISNLPAESIEKLSSEIEEISKSQYSEEIRADLMDDILNIAIEELNNLPEDTLSELINNAEATVDEILESPEDYINPESEESSGCFPEEWINPEIRQLPPIWLLTGSTIGCIPENSIFEEYRNRIDSNLRKIHSCRNIAGVQRILPMYEASVDPMSIVKSVSSGAGFGDINFSNAAGIGPYRFGYLIERAKALANLVAQTGNALLSAIEKKESEELSYLRAQQEINLTKANVHLRKLGVVEAESYLILTSEQTARAQFQKDHFQKLIEIGINDFEEKALNEFCSSIMALKEAQILQIAAAWASLLPSVSTGGVGIPNYAGALSNFAAQRSTLASIHSTTSSIYSMTASFQRRIEDWGLQKSLAEIDKAISIQNEQIANDRIVIAEMEQQIAEMTAEHADQTLEFLKEKFTNKELYVWMTKILSKLHYGFYNLAYTNAKMAQATLEFERNETLDFISYGYWDSEKKGLLSGDQLLLDINQLDNHYIKNNARKLEITKHISLANMAPEAISALKSNGIMTFATPMSWFDRDFPGHYQRIIKSVKATVIALIGPTSGINATLSTISPSRVVLDPDNPEPPEPVTRIQSVALSSASNATGLFELNYRDERYLPFEGCGVDVSWKLEMPKPSNQFDFNSIMDVIMTIDYTALSNSEYKKFVIGELGTDSGVIATLSSRISFPDEWYHFNNPVFLKPRSQGDDPYQDGKSRVPYSMKLAVTRQMFPPNEEEHSIESVALLFSLKDTNIRVPVTLKYSPETGEAFESGPSSTGQDGYLAVPNNIENKSPFGTWEIFIDRAKAGDLWVIKDDGTPLIENDSHVLDINKINDVLIAITYRAELKWPEKISG